MVRVAVEPVAPVSVGDVIADKYRIDRILGVGGMGYVVAATHLQIDQRVAIKFVRSGVQSAGAGDSGERLMREARAAAKLRSEHVTRVYDVGHLPHGHPQGGTSFIVMELVEGRELSKIVDDSRGGLPVPDAVEYVLQVCAALVEAHAAGIVHRDLKPQNLVLARRIQGTPLVKVLDFGIAKDTSGLGEEAKSLTDSSVVLGSPLYMSPEQMRGGRDVSPRTDLWAVGVMLYQFLSGALPFDAPTVPELCVKVLTLDPPPLLGVAPHVPPVLAAIVERCLQKEPQLRFSSAAELAAHLEPFSRSAERGMMDRPWRSLAETVDSGGAMSPPSLDSGASPARTGGSGALGQAAAVTTGFTNVSLSGAAPPDGRRFKKRTFFFGASLGALAAIVAAVTVSAEHMNARPQALRLPEQVVARGLASSGSALPSPLESSSADPKAKSDRVVPAVGGPGIRIRPYGTEVPVAATAPSETKAPPTAPSASATVKVGVNGAPILQ